MILEDVRELCIRDHASSSMPAWLAREAMAAAVGERIWACGDLSILQQPLVAIGGSRRAGAHGLETLELLARELAHRGLAILSGGAVGTDMAAHCSALDAGGRTVFVLPIPLHELDVSRWRPELAARDLSRTLFLSPFAPNDRIDRRSPVIRNRWMALLGCATVAGETGVTGGTVHLLRFAVEFRRLRYFLRDFPTIDDRLPAAWDALTRQGAQPFTRADLFDARFCDTMASEIKQVHHNRWSSPPKSAPDLFDGLEGER